MQAKIDTLRVKDENGDEHLLYPRTLTKSVIDEDGNTLANTLADIESRLPENIDARFLTSDGYGGLRYYNGKFQYYDDASAKWVDVQATTDNSLLVTLAPQPMKSFAASCDPGTGGVKLLIDESPDTIVDDQVLCVVEKVIIRRKKDSVPTDENDGDLVLELGRRNFGKYKQNAFVDVIDGATTGDVYYYKAFPVSTSGIVANLPDDETSCVIKDYHLYGFKIDQNESDPASMITYIEDNANYQSAYMDYTADSFNYGDWANAWFIKNLKPVMLNYDGTVAYELDKNDYSLKTDGTASDITDETFEGNAMMGIPKVYWKIVDNGDDTANVYISNKQLDSDFHCWSHIDNNGNEIDYCYMPIYTGSLYNNTLRSLSGKTPIANYTRHQEVDYAKANNSGSDVIWYTEVYSDRMLINILLLLVGKSTDTQTIYGAGNNISYTSSSNTGVKNTGSMDTKGLFWGNQDNVSGVKVFGMEHYWGNQSRAVSGWVINNGTQTLKMTYGLSDGSTVEGYNFNGDGYIPIGNSAPNGTSGGYISKMLLSDKGLLYLTTGGSSTTYYGDGLWFNNSEVNYALLGGAADCSSRVGAFCSSLNDDSLYTSQITTASISCKPLATT